MKKSFTGIAAVLLVAAMALALAGCGGGAPAESSARPSSETDSPAPASTPPESQAPSAPSSAPPAPTPDSHSPEPSYYKPDDAPLIFFIEHYYLDGDYTEPSLYFWDDGDVVLEYDGESVYGEYLIDDDEIDIYIDGNWEMTLIIINCAVLEDDDTGGKYTLMDALEDELELSDWYYYNGDYFAGSLWFWDDGTVDIEDEAGDIIVADYYVSGYWVTIEYEDAEIELFIENSYILEYEGDYETVLFIRRP